MRYSSCAQITLQYVLTTCTSNVCLCCHTLPRSQGSKLPNNSRNSTFGLPKIICGQQTMSCNGCVAIVLCVNKVSMQPGFYLEPQILKNIYYNKGGSCHGVCLFVFLKRPYRRSPFLIFYYIFMIYFYTKVGHFQFYMAILRTELMSGTGHHQLHILENTIEIKVLSFATNDMYVDNWSSSSHIAVQCVNLGN